ncbi:MAG: hypothetical protein Q7R70_03510 [Candidatus Diapherotrites archaeon]|nr:hypothetical protein [Candidatus Diapherotrites archaeon]
MTDCFEVGDCLKGDRIAAEARKLSRPRIVAKTGRHQAQQIVLWENAFCVIEKKLRFVPQR